MSTAIATRNMVGAPSALVPRSLEETKEMARMLSTSGLVPEQLRGKPADIFLILAYGLEVGLPPVAALRSVAVIKGKPAPHADALVAIVLASGLCEYFIRISSSETEATYETKRKGNPSPQRETFTIQQAEAAGLTSNHSWKTWRKKLLEARAKAFLARDVYADVCAGIYVAEEVEDFKDDNEPQGKIIEATFTAPPAPAPANDTPATPEKPKAARKAREAKQPPSKSESIVDILEADPELKARVEDHVIVRAAEERDGQLYAAMNADLGALKNSPAEYELAKEIHRSHKPHLDNKTECNCVALATSLLVPILRGAK